MFKNRKSTLAILLLLICSGCNRDGPLLLNTPLDEISHALDVSVPELMSRRNVAGMSIAVVRDGETAIFKSFGYSDVASDSKMERGTIFRAASLGKPILAYIAVKLAKQHKLELNKPLYAYMGEEVVKGDARSKSITARMVLSHSSGLPNLNGTKSDIKFLFEPGEAFAYSGHGYLYLQRVLEKITGKYINELAEEMVFSPLGMKESSFIWKSEFSGRVASSYSGSGEEYPSEDNPVQGYSAWSLFTTLEDYTRFVTWVIEESSQPNSVSAELLKPNVDVAKGVKWGLGWGLQATVPNFSFWHWGSMAGFRHYVVAYPKEGLAVIVMTNTANAFEIVDDIMAKAIGGSYPSYDWF